MAEAVPHSVPSTSAESVAGYNALRLQQLKTHAPDLSDDLMLVAIHRESVDGFVADHTTAVARQRTEKVQQEWQEYRNLITKEELLLHKIQTAWQKKRAVRTVAAEGVLGGARNVEAGMLARKEILASNNPYAMQVERQREMDLQVCEPPQVTEWATARHSITERMARARVYDCNRLAGETIQTLANTKEDIAEQKLRGVIKDLLTDTISQQTSNGKHFPDSVIAKWFCDDIRKQLSAAEYAALFGSNASAVVIADAICAAKQVLQFHFAEHGIHTIEEIEVVIEAAIGKSSITAATARAGAVGGVPRSIEKLTDQMRLRNEHVGKALAPIARIMGGSAVRAGVTATLVVAAGAKGLLLSTGAGGVVAPVMTAARSYITARRDVAFDQRTVASGEQCWVDQETRTYMQAAQPAEELLHDLDTALSGFMPKREAARLLHWIDLLHAQPTIDLIRYQPGTTDVQRNELLRQVAELRQQLEGENIFVPTEHIREEFMERFGSVRGEMESYYWTRTLQAKRLGKAALFGIIGGGMVGLAGLAIHELTDTLTAAQASASVVEKSVPLPTPSTAVTPWPERVIMDPTPVPAKLEDGKLPLSDDTSLHASKGLKLMPGIGGLKILGKKGEVLADAITVDVTAKGEPSPVMRTALLKKGFVVEDSPMTTRPMRAKIVHQQVSARQFMAAHKNTFTTMEVAARTWPVVDEQPVFATAIRSDGRVQLIARGVTPKMHDRPLHAVITLNETEESIVIPLGKDNRLTFAPDHPLAQVVARGEFASAEVAEVQGDRLAVLTTSTGENFGDAHQEITHTTTRKIPEKPAEKVFVVRQLAIPPQAQELTPSDDLVLRSGGNSNTIQNSHLAQQLTVPALLMIGTTALGTVLLAHRGRQQAFLREVNHWATQISYHFQNMADNPLTRSAVEINQLLLQWQGKMASQMGRKNAEKVYQAAVARLGIRDLLSKEGKVHKEIEDQVFATIQAFAAPNAA